MNTIAYKEWTGNWDYNACKVGICPIYVEKEFWKMPDNDLNKFADVHICLWNGYSYVI